MLLFFNGKYTQGWPEPYIYSVHDRMFGMSLPKIPHIHRMLRLDSVIMCDLSYIRVIYHTHV